MTRRFRLLLALPALLLLAGCSDPTGPRNDDGEDPKEPPPETDAYLPALVTPPILV